MTRFLRYSIVLFGLLMLSVQSHADSIRLGPNASIDSVLSDHVGQRTSVVLESGNELTGKVVAVSNGMLHLEALAGREYFDAAISTDDIAAIIVRTKQ